MASSLAALASPVLPTKTKLSFKTSQYHSTRCFSKRLQVAEFSGLRASSSVTLATRDASEASFLDVIVSQLNPKTKISGPIRGETVATLKVAVNGFGRVGRVLFRQWLQRLKNTGSSPIEIVAVNDLGGVQNARYLLKHDSTFGAQRDYAIEVVDNQTLSLTDNTSEAVRFVKVFSNPDPLQLPWAAQNIDLVIEASGEFLDRCGAGKHIQAGAKKVIITDPAKGDSIPTYIVGINEGDYSHDSDIISNGSPVGSSMAPVVKVLHEEFGIITGNMTSTHAYTGDQRLLEAPGRDLWRSRAALLSIVPVKSNAAESVGLVLPQLKGKLESLVLRVPTANMSCIEVVVNVEKKGVTVDEVNAAFTKASEESLKGIVGVSNLPLVSVDFLYSDASAVVDTQFTTVLGDDMVKVLAWYDNEWVYSERVLDFAYVVASKWPGLGASRSGNTLITSS